MAAHRITKGLDLPIAGDPQQTIAAGPKLRRVALLGADYVGMKPKMEAKVGDKVLRGQLLFEDRKAPGVRFTAPAAGQVVAIHRGEKRAFQSIVIELDGSDDQVQFASYSGPSDSASPDAIKALLLESGLWTALRMRPFSRVPSPDATPRALFVTAVDTNPHAPDVATVLKGKEADFTRGLAILSKLAPKSFLCKSSKLQVNAPSGVQVEDFDGLHPAGNVGTHIHMLSPVDRERVVWHIGYQDVIAVGVLFATGKLDPRRVVSLAGPVVQRPRLLETQLGASLDELTAGELKAGENRVISGSVLSGRTAAGEALGYLGRHHHQVSALLEGRQRELLGWLAPGANKFSIIPVYFGFLGKLFGKKFAMTTTTNGSPRAMVPIGMYERIMPLDIHPTFLLRSLLVGDTDRAIQLGALELDEEDLALCTFVDPGKADFGVVLRKNLSEIEKGADMQFLRNLLDKAEKPFHKGGKLEKLYPLYEATDTFLYTPKDVTQASSHVRDAIDLKRMMITVVIALLPCVLFAMYNTGFQANYAIAHGAAALANWQTWLYTTLGFGFDPTSILACMIHGAIYFLPVYAITMLIGGHAEVIFAIIRKHEINEGFLVTGLLFPLTLPPTIPLWQVALGIIFGVVIGKEVFGGTGMNVLNPALVARAFLFFAYPGQISGDGPWIAADLTGPKADALSGATALAQAAVDTPAMMAHTDWWNAFIGLEPGSMGETSTLACLIGALILIVTGVGSWRTMFGVTLGTFATAALLNAIGSPTNSLFGLPPVWHFVLGGWAFGMVFMATDPVSSAFTAWGKVLYGFGIGFMVVLVRVINPAYPEGMMLAILFMNMFAPLIDYYIVKANITRRSALYGTR